MSLTGGLVSYWKLDESSGNASDSVGSKTLTNTSATYSSGVINKGAVFNGSAYLTNTSTFFADASGSISIWFKTSISGTPGTCIFSQSITTANTRFVIFPSTASNGDVYFDITVSGIQQLTFYTTGLSLADGNWHHLVITMDSGGNKIYKDGVQVVSGTTYQVGTSATQKWFSAFTANHLDIGATNYNNAGYISKFNGSVDEVGVWNRSLTADEVSKLYSAGRGLTYPFLPTNISFRPGSLGSML